MRWVISRVKDYSFKDKTGTKLILQNYYKEAYLEQNFSFVRHKYTSVFSYRYILCLCVCVCVCVCILIEGLLRFSFHAFALHVSSKLLFVVCC